MQLANNNNNLYSNPTTTPTWRRERESSTANCPAIESCHQRLSYAWLWREGARQHLPARWPLMHSWCWERGGDQPVRGAFSPLFAIDPPLDIRRWWLDLRVFLTHRKQQQICTKRQQFKRIIRIRSTRRALHPNNIWTKCSVALQFPFRFSYPPFFAELQRPCCVLLAFLEQGRIKTTGTLASDGGNCVV